MDGDYAEVTPLVGKVRPRRGPLRDVWWPRRLAAVGKQHRPPRRARPGRWTVTIPLQLTLTPFERNLELAVKGELDCFTAAALLAVVRGALEMKPRRLELDLSNTWFMDSGGVDALVA